MKRNMTAQQHNFALIPGTQVQRSRFRMRQTRKQAFNASELVPIYCEPVLPGDVWEHKESIMARLSTPIAPLLDDLDIETFYFFEPNRLTWRGELQGNLWEDFISGKNTTLVMPKIRPFLGSDFEVIENGLFDHYGILPQNYNAANPRFAVNVLPIWAYFDIYNKWFRDQNLQSEFVWAQNWTTSSSNAITRDTIPWDQKCVRANKRHDQFTSSLPWAQKGSPVQMPLGVSAPVYNEEGINWTNFVSQDYTTPAAAVPQTLDITAVTPHVIPTAALSGTLNNQLRIPKKSETAIHGTSLYADLSTATAATINSMRLAVVTQHLLEADARGGSRYVEQLLVHFGVRAQDSRLQNPEYLGGSRIPITINPIAQTAAYSPDGGTTENALGNLGAEMHASGTRRTFRFAAPEHGYIIGIAVVRATPTYQQGTRHHWRINTRLDHYFPEFANLGEEAIPTQEIYQPANDVPSVATWGYQERSYSYRYTPNEITGTLRSTATAAMDWWHLAELFATEPGLNPGFITDKTQEVLARALATDDDETWSAQIIMDILHDATVARLMPAYSVPGLKRF